jgi:predicted NAD/FAD-dependent oxidoreductase
MSQNVDVLIVGAGMSGLMAARTLVEAGKSVLVLDKGRSVGGRMATRRIGSGAADHGTQFFTARAPEFTASVQRWQADGLVFEWSRGWSNGSLMAATDGHPRYAVRGGMNALMKHLAAGLDTRVKLEVMSVELVNGGWEVRDGVGTRQQARALLLTPPIPQSLALLDEGGVQLAETDRTALERIEYERCLAALFSVQGDVHLPAPGAIQRPHAPIYWIADNRRKGVSPQAAIVTMQAGPVYSRQLWELDDEDILRSFRVDLMPFLDDRARVIEGQLKRWRYAQPSVVFPERCLVAADQASPLVFAGDAFGVPRVEGAFLSGLAAGQRLAELLQ